MTNLLDMIHCLSQLELESSGLWRGSATAGIAASNPAEDMNVVSLVFICCVVVCK
jgi:hypothetical protein